jgi:hypothetical protein
MSLMFPAFGLDQSAMGVKTWAFICLGPFVVVSSPLIGPSMRRHQQSIARAFEGTIRNERNANAEAEGVIQKPKRHAIRNVQR